MPVTAAGPLIDPPVSVPTLSGVRRAAIAAPDPEEEPAAVYSAPQGLTTGPNPDRRPLPVPNSRRFNLPSRIAPAELRRSTIVESYSGTQDAVTLDPFVVVMPRVATRSFGA